MFLQTAKILLVLLIFSLFYIQPFVVIDSFQIPPTEFIFLFAGFFWLLAVLSKQTRLRFHKFYLPLTFYAAAMLISAVLAENKQTSFIKFGGEIYLLSLPVLIFNLIDSEKELKRLIKVWLIGTLFSILVGAFAVFLFYYHRESWILDYTNGSFGAVPVGNYPRLRVNFLTPSLLCNYLSVSFSLLLIAFELDWIKQTMFIVFAMLICLIAAFTISSGLGAFALVVGLWIFFVYRKKHKSFAVLSLGGGLFVALVFWAINFIALQAHSTAAYSFIVFGKEFYPSPRLMVWTASWQTFSENFLFGRGVGQDSCEVVFQNTDGSFASLTDAHNVFLSVATQEGIFGLAAILLVIFYLLKMKPAVVSTTDKIFVISIGLWIAFVSAFVYQGLVGSFEDSRHLWALIGLMLCADNLAHRAK